MKNWQGIIIVVVTLAAAIIVRKVVGPLEAMPLFFFAGIVAGRMI